MKDDVISGAYHLPCIHSLRFILLSLFSTIIVTYFHSHFNFYFINSFSRTSIPFQISIRLKERFNGVINCWPNFECNDLFGRVYSELAACIGCRLPSTTQHLLHHHISSSISIIPVINFMFFFQTIQNIRYFN